MPSSGNPKKPLSLILLSLSLLGIEVWIFDCWKLRSMCRSLNFWARSRLVAQATILIANVAGNIAPWEPDMAEVVAVVAVVVAAAVVAGGLARAAVTAKQAQRHMYGH